MSVNLLELECKNEEKTEQICSIWPSSIVRILGFGQKKKRDKNK